MSNPLSRPWNRLKIYPKGEIVSYKNGYYTNKNGKNEEPSIDSQEWIYNGEINPFFSLASINASNLTGDNLAAWKAIFDGEANFKIGIADDGTLDNGFDVPIEDLLTLAFSGLDFEYELDEANGVVLLKSKGGGSATVQDVSATVSGIVNNTSLQELGGKDKLIYGLRIGRGSGNWENNLVFGRNALKVNTTGKYNVAIGNGDGESEGVLQSNTTGKCNTAVGSDSMLTNTTGNYNSAYGNSALLALTTGVDNTAIGSNAGRDLATGSRNTFVGSYTGYISKTASDNVSIGYAAGGKQYEDQSGGTNTSIGTQAASYLSSGIGNISIGYRSANALRSGQYNICIGVQSGDVTTGTPPPAATWNIGNHNVYIGHYAGVSVEGISAQGSLGFLVIHNSTAPTANPLILGNFYDRFLKISGIFSVNPTYLAAADSTYTKNLVAKPDGTFGWEDKNKVYAVTESLTGDVWVDGKVMYRKFVTINIPINDGNIINFDAAVGGGIQTIIGFEKCFLKVTGETRKSAPNLNGGTQRDWFYAIESENQLLIGVGAASATARTVTGVLIYTKSVGL